jgi:hypothetical protein
VLALLKTEEEFHQQVLLSLPSLLRLIQVAMVIFQLVQVAERVVRQLVLEGQRRHGLIKKQNRSIQATPQLIQEEHLYRLPLVQGVDL